MATSREKTSAAGTAADSAPRCAHRRPGPAAAQVLSGRCGAGPLLPRPRPVTVLRLLSPSPGDPSLSPKQITGSTSTTAGPPPSPAPPGSFLSASRPGHSPGFGIFQAQVARQGGACGEAAPLRDASPLRDAFHGLVGPSCARARIPTAQRALVQGGSLKRSQPSPARLFACGCKISAKTPNFFRSAAKDRRISL